MKRRGGIFAMSRAILYLIMVTALLAPALPIQASDPISVHFDRIRESPVDVTFRVTITGIDGDYPTKVEFSGMSAEAKVTQVQEVKQEQYIVEESIYADIDNTVTDLLNVADKPVSLSTDIKNYLKLQSGQDSLRTKITDLEKIKDGVKAPDKVGGLTRKIEIGTQAVAKIRTVKPEIAKFTDIDQVKQYNTEIRGGKKVYEVTINTGLAVNPDKGGYGSKGVLVLDINGTKYFDMANSSWWDASWLYRNVLSFNGTGLSAPTNNSTILVSLTSANFDFTKALTNGEDIRFVDKDDATNLPYEIVSWNGTTQLAKIWVQVPQIDNSNYADYIHLYYGNSGASDNQDKNAVWANTGAVGVWHLDATSNNGTTIYDSTSNSNNGTAIGTNNWTSQGRGFNGIDNRISISNSASLSLSGNITTLSWFKTTGITATGYGTLLTKNSGTKENYSLTIPTDTQKVAFNTYDGAAFPTATSVGTVNDNAWHIAAGIRDIPGDKVKVYLDNAAVVQVTDTTTDTITNTANVTIGFYANRQFVGTIREVRIYNQVSSTDTIKIDYLNSIDSLLYYGSTNPTPTMVTKAAISPTMNKDGVTGGTFTGNITSLGGAPSANVSFDYGIGAFTASTALQAVTTTGNITAAFPATLTPGATYKYRAVGTNGAGTSYGDNVTFALTLPTLTSSAFTNVSYSGSSITSTLNGNISDMGVASNAYAYFEYGETTAYGSVTPSATVTVAGDILANITTSTWGITLHARPVVRINTTYIYGADQTTTIPPRTDTFTALTSVLFIIPSVLFLVLVFGASWVTIRKKSTLIERVMSIICLLLLIDLFLVFLIAVNNLIAGHW